MTQFVRSCIVVSVFLAAVTARARAQDHPVILQWYEQEWANVEHRLTDYFLAGYGAVWLPPPSLASAKGSVGYDVFDRFHLGTPESPTAYGTEQSFRAAIAGLHDTGSLVYIDSIMNHNSGRQTSAQFQTDGGYPGFWMASDSPPRDKTPQSNWGDFHAGTSSGYLQSIDPGGVRYDVLKGDLVGLIDIAQETNHRFIRHPVDVNDPRNIPNGTVRNLPDTGNYRFYPDSALSPFSFTNPGTPRNPGSTHFTLYPFNIADPMQGDPTPDNTTGLLMRWTQWMMDDFAVDGFRLDAAKHVPSWFWDTYWDAAVFQRRTTPWGARVTPLSFVESVDGNAFTYANYIRRHDGFGNRDALDLNGAGALRDLISQSGFGTWQSALNAHIDTADDGLNNGSIGIGHVLSHDNGSVGDGSSRPRLPTAREVGLVEHAFALMRPGPVIVYHNARGITRPGGFWPREGIPIALGYDEAVQARNASLTKLVSLRTEVARGEFNVLNSTDPTNKSLDDVIVFERRTALAGGGYLANCLAAMNDRYDVGVQQRFVQTSFTPGTRLHELTGNAADPLVDPGNTIPQVLTVDANRRVLITVPNNRSSSGEHNQGYVVYAPALPSGNVTLANWSSAIPSSNPTVPPYMRRLNPVLIVKDDSFEIQLTTTRTDPTDPNADDAAVFRIDQGFVDYNGNGTVDLGPEHAVAPGFEHFLTENRPLYGSAASTGTYRQVIDATTLAEGYHYITVFAFRHRDAQAAPLLRQWRLAVYIDRQEPQSQLVDPTHIITKTWHQFTIQTADRTVNKVHALLDVPAGTNPLTLVGPANQATQRDRFEHRATFTDLTHGLHSLTIVTFEESGNTSIDIYKDILVDLCYADLNKDGQLDIFDFLAFQNYFVTANPLACDCDISTGTGVCDIFDFLCFQEHFVRGCP